MSDLKATVCETDAGFHVQGYEKIEYDFAFVDGVFDIANPQLANCYRKWGRVLAVTDKNNTLNTSIWISKSIRLPSERSQDHRYISKHLRFDDRLRHHSKRFACAAYRRNTNFIRVPTTVIGLIDASVSIKVAVNYGRYKNRLGAYHAPLHTFLDFGFLQTLPTSQVRNSFAELIKISSCAHLEVFDLLDKFCEQLINTHFGRVEGSARDVRMAADIINREDIYEMLKLESPNLHEIGLDRVTAFSRSASSSLMTSLTHDLVTHAILGKLTIWLHNESSSSL
ncbi:hypothetical protein RRF57_012297 [Xylaria bambusicola]|uniref:3-dehydroquinate synthase N-terminal domain-containing protein n=1 Tax=Xylaria bambusicola TaxID=326684 RepID=A0AAN7V3U3_9PEZI